MYRVLLVSQSPTARREIRGGCEVRKSRLVDEDNREGGPTNSIALTGLVKPVGLVEHVTANQKVRINEKRQYELGLSPTPVIACVGLSVVDTYLRSTALLITHPPISTLKDLALKSSIDEATTDA